MWLDFKTATHETARMTNWPSFAALDEKHDIGMIYCVQQEIERQWSLITPVVTGVFAWSLDTLLKFRDVAQI